MWINESRRLSQADLRLLAELVAEDSGLSSDAASQFVTKVTSYAGFSVTQPGQFAFEHDVYFDHFLSRALRRQLQTSVKPSYLDRGILPSEVVLAAVDRQSLAQNVIDNVLSVLDANVLHDNRRRNGGTLFAAAARILKNVAAREVGHLELVNLSLRDVTFHDVKFVDSNFRNVSLIGTKFVNCSAVNTGAYSLEISAATRFEVNGLVPGEGLYSLRLIGRNEEIFSPQEMREILAKLGGPVVVQSGEAVKYSERQTTMLKLLERIVQKYKRTNVLCVEEDPGTATIAQNPLWPELKKVLLGSGVVREEVRPTSGRRKMFLRPTVSMEQLVSYESERRLPEGPVGEFWNSIRGG